MSYLVLGLQRVTGAALGALGVLGAPAALGAARARRAAMPLGDNNRAATTMTPVRYGHLPPF